MLRALSRVVDSLQLFEDEVAVRTCHEGAMATKTLDHVVVAHDAGREER